MAESLSTEQIEERRTNLRAFRAMLFMKDDSQLTTTLLMQEEWLATVDELQEFARDANILRGLRTRQCLGPTGGLALECQDCYGDIAKYCAPCYLRAIHMTPEMRQGIREGVKAVEEGRIRPWSEVEAEIFGPAIDEVMMGAGGEEFTTECEVAGHIWVKMGKVGLDAHGLSAMDWGETKCLRCNEPYDVGFDTE